MCSVEALEAGTEDRNSHIAAIAVFVTVTVSWAGKFSINPYYVDRNGRPLADGTDD